MKQRTGAEMFRSLIEMDDELARAGVPPLSSWWRAEAERFYLSGAPNWWGEVGRGGSKSSTLEKVELNEGLFQRWTVPPGKTHWAVHVSENLDEAGARLQSLDHCLTILGEPHTWAGDEIRLQRLPRGFVVRPARLGAVSGFRAFFTGADELTKWIDDGKSKVGTILGSMGAMAITHSSARHLRFSSTMGKVGEHYTACERGDVPGVQVVSRAASWIANPDVITYEQTRRAETDERTWRREYANLPQEARLAAFPGELIERAFRVPPLFDRTGRQILVLDPSSGKKDAWSWMRISFVRERLEIPLGAVSGRRLESYLAPTPFGYSTQAQRYVDTPWRVQQPDGTWKDVEISRQRTFMLVEDIDGVEGRFYDQVGADQIVARVAHLARQYGISSVHSDQRESFSLKALFQQHGIAFQEHTWTGGDTGLKSQIVTALRRRLAEGTIIFPQHDRLKRELQGFEERVLPSGQLTFGGGRGIGGADDYVACVLTAQAAEIEGGTWPNVRVEVSGR